MNIKPWLSLVAACGIGTAASATDLVPQGAFVQGGVGDSGARSVTAGVYWSWDWRRSLGSAELSGVTEAYVSRWSSRFEGHREGVTQVALVPLFRLRPEGGASPWFMELGIGISTMDKLYRTRDEGFSTRFNFVDVLGFGHSFGEGRRHELSLRFAHVSNANIKSPNPGQNFLQLRYAASF
jgi:hypothetical protein